MAGKRAHGEGYITQTPNGKWRGQLMDGNDPITGKRIIRSFTAPTKRELLQKMRDYKEQKLHPPEPEPVLFQAWADRWYQDYRTQVEASTYANYKYTLQALEKHFGETAVSNPAYLHQQKEASTRLASFAVSKQRKAQAAARAFLVTPAAPTGTTAAGGRGRTSKTPTG